MYFFCSLTFVFCARLCRSIVCLGSMHLLTVTNCTGSPSKCLIETMYIKDTKVCVCLQQCDAEGRSGVTSSHERSCHLHLLLRDSHAHSSSSLTVVAASPSLPASVSLTVSMKVRTRSCGRDVCSQQKALGFTCKEIYTHTCMHVSAKYHRRGCCLAQWVEQAPHV